MSRLIKKLLKIFTRKRSEVESSLFCNICKKPKKEKFCKHCKKETLDHHIIKVPPFEMEMSLNRPGLKIKRGGESFDYFIVAFNVLAAFLIAVISVSEFQSIYKIIFIFISVFGAYYLCFKGPHFRNLIVGLFAKAKNHEDVL
ncbi:MAG: hypothetical protein RBS86_04915 [Candidatus Moranbacteria bacterium]|jgi:hypothetical protein|nr:hypothetical protein [Candidatus Moranbacteria bacterium]